MGMFTDGNISPPQKVLGESISNQRNSM